MPGALSTLGCTLEGAALRCVGPSNITFIPCEAPDSITSMCVCMLRQPICLHSHLGLYRAVSSSSFAQSLTQGPSTAWPRCFWSPALLPASRVLPPCLFTAPRPARQPHPLQPRCALQPHGPPTRSAQRVPQPPGRVRWPFNIETVAERFRSFVGNRLRALERGVIGAANAPNMTL